MAVKAAFAKAAARAAESTLRISSAGKPVALGTVVDAGGLVVSKASVLSGELTCRLKDGRDVPAKLIAADEDYDLALLKVEADKLTPVSWRSGNPPAGTLITAAGTDGQTLAVGAVSTEARRIGGSPAPRGNAAGWASNSAGATRAWASAASRPAAPPRRPA